MSRGDSILENRSPAVTTFVLLTMLLSGCRLQDAKNQRLVAVESRFTENPLFEASDGTVVSTAHKSASVKVGLTMQSGADPVHVSFASQLGTVLVRELQLSPGSFEVQPLTTLTTKTPTLPIEMSTPSDVRSVSFHDSQNALPPDLPPNPAFLTPAPPIVDQILVVRVIEYRAYFPMLATLEIKVLNGETQDAIFTTTATWSGVDYQLATDQSKRKNWCRNLFRKDNSCDPSPGHNSPQVLMHEIAGDITSWYDAALNEPNCTKTVVIRKKMTRQRLLNDVYGF